MDTADNFDRLVSELSQGERRELFRKLESQEIVSSAPLFRAEELPESVVVERRFREAPLLLKLYLRLLSVFLQKTPIKIFESRLIAHIGAAIEHRYSGLFDHKRNLLLNRMYKELVFLKESSRFFYDALDGSVVRDKGAFFAFLASLELDVVHQRLITETDPDAYASTNSQATEPEIRQAVHKALESILETIDEAQRAVMYRNVRSLFCVKELASFLFDRTLSAFSGSLDSKTCPAYLLLDQLMVLNDILYSLDFPPSMPLLESLFVFDLQDQVGAEGFDLELETKKLVTKAEEALMRIRQFNQNVPLTAMLRCCSCNLAYLPAAITGGEDWFATYRDFWKKRIDERFAIFIKHRRREQLEESLSALFNGKPLPRLNFLSVASDDAPNVRNAFMLTFLAGFCHTIFVDEISRALKILLLDGEFYKKDNRIEFTDAYNELLKLEDSILGLEKKLSPEGEIGKRFELSRNEIIALPLKRRKNAALQMEVDSEAASIIDRAGRSLRSIAGVLGGVLHGEVGGKYDTLSNMGTLSGRGTSTFISSLRNALQKTEKAVQMLGEIEALESVR
ncbi:MAG: DUF5312 family protein [Treponemataceae bacterium]